MMMIIGRENKRKQKKKERKRKHTKTNQKQTHQPSLVGVKKNFIFFRFLPTSTNKYA